MGISSTVGVKHVSIHEKRNAGSGWAFLLDWQFIDCIDSHIPEDACGFRLDVRSTLTSLGCFVPLRCELPSPFDADIGDMRKNYRSSGFERWFVVREP